MINFYFPYKQTNGILNYFYKRNKKFFNNTNIFSYNSSGCHLSHFGYNIFDLGSNSYWLHYSEKDVFVSFCFKKGFVDLDGYELQTISGISRPYIWSLSASNDNMMWFGNQSEEYPMNQSVKHYVPWHNGPARCFRLDILKNINGGKGCDVKQIELFGKFIADDLRPISCKTRRNDNMLMIALMLSIIT